MKKRYCIFQDTLFQGKIVGCHDENEMPVTYATRREAELEVLSVVEEYIAQIKDGTRLFDDGWSIDEWIEEVTVDEQGNVHDENGTVFGRRE